MAPGPPGSPATGRPSRRWWRQAGRPPPRSAAGRPRFAPGWWPASRSGENGGAAGGRDPRTDRRPGRGSPTTPRLGSCDRHPSPATRLGLRRGAGGSFTGRNENKSHSLAILARRLASPTPGGHHLARPVPAPIRPARPARGAHPLDPGRPARHLDSPARTGLLLPRRRDRRLPGPRARRRARLRGAAGSVRRCDRLQRRDIGAGAPPSGRSGQPHGDGLGRVPGGGGDPGQRRLPFRLQRRDPAVRQPASDRRAGHRAGRGGRGGQPRRHRPLRPALAGRRLRPHGRAVGGRRRPLPPGGPAGPDRARDHRRPVGDRRPARRRPVRGSGGHRASADQPDAELADRQRRPGRRWREPPACGSR